MFSFPSNQDEKAVINHNYFWSNGLRVIYVKPIHFVDTSDLPSDPHNQVELGNTSHHRNQIRPMIIGLTTNDSSLIRGFEEHFNSIFENKK